MIDKLIIEFDKGLRTVFGPARTVRAMPGADVPEGELSAADRQEAAALMRVNHCGEVCAQALYQGQALVSRDDVVRRTLDSAAREETEHLAWTEQRIAELGGRKSVLNPLWFGASLAVGVLAGKLGDRWSLGFLAETERQVEAHLKSHLERLPAADAKSRRVVEQMKDDEAGHAEAAIALGAHDLPAGVQRAMRVMAKVMTTVAHRI